MARKPDEWMPLHIGAYLKDTTRLTRDQHGAYFLLLLAYWCDGGPLVADDGALGAIVKATPAEWRKLRPVMLRFFQERDGHWHQKRADEELAKARRLVAAKAEAGKKGAQTRWQDNNRTNGKPDGTAMADASNSQRQTDAPLPSPEPTEETPSLRSGVARGARIKASKRSLPENFPDENARKWAESHWLAKGRADLVGAMDEEAAKFRDHHTSNAKTSADWPGSWRTWVRNAMNFSKANRNGHGKITGHQALAAAALSIVQEAESRPGERDFEDAGPT